MLGQSCSDVNHCGNARTCERCARERQRRIADKAEALEKQYGQLTFTRLTPEKNTQDEIRRLRASFLRRALAPAGIWTVETGEKFKGLHLNILSPAPAPAKWRNCTTYSELLQTTARDAAAYIAKRSGMPAIEQFAGNLYGAFGQIGAILASQRANPLLQAAAIESALAGPAKKTPDSHRNNLIEYRTWEEEKQGWTPQHMADGTPYWTSKAHPEKYTRKPPQPERSAEERREIMRRHLPNLYAIIRKEQQHTTAEPAPNEYTGEW